MRYIRTLYLQSQQYLVGTAVGGGRVTRALANLHQNHNLDNEMENSLRLQTCPRGRYLELVELAKVARGWSSSTLKERDTSAKVVYKNTL